MKEFDIRTEGEANSVAVICDTLAKNAINIDALSINGDVVRLVQAGRLELSCLISKWPRAESCASGGKTIGVDHRTLDVRERVFPSSCGAALEHDDWI